MTKHTNPASVTRNTNKPILIVGGGFGGMRVARLLSKRRKELGHPILLIDKHRHHVYTPLLYEVASGCTTGAEMELSLIRGATFRFGEVMRSCCEIASAQGTVTGVDATRQEARLADGSVLAYGALVLALGSETDFFGIPGLRERAVTLKTRQDALDIRRRVEALMAPKRNGRKNGTIRLVVGGGGATGTEFAAEMACCFRSMVRRGALKRDAWEVTLVEATNRLLGMLKPELSAFAKRRLERLGVRVMLDTCFKGVEDGTVVITPRPLKPGESAGALVCDLRPGSEKRLPADCIVWTGGVRGPSVLKSFNLPLDPKDRVIVDSSMRVKGRRNLYAVGDCASLTDPKTGRPVPSLAQAATREADVAAANILADEGLAKTRRAYDFPSFHTVVPLGGKYALACIGRVTITGFLGWVVRRLADLRYFVTALPVRYALHAYIRGAWLYVKND
ncbi:hypothetical protein A3E39_02915 [Candidatus Uhrbacteria bacterium RIFCSPHIGHO2_12_FULL_60_25]|uniref:FAD/NAD(P)-binding domain-containing protein n=1 Tax=Candidatus Uhrbacteria bacterium RIFCSPHIGHO2_12_FULL_60_25 TaxID=1802399 RepID=A0A1F7UJK0_9BACT|nr:MAG: hypothetical protein A3D73_01790 [Candidatus Uhrbacteria bacterium RIFCSPHIGHO2_02_FULL_60_44]OGL78425.1 MAG: hypothetical protein A3E39_02915 [Candidatus Uhrbacteria bacterium RIFCSPHIGHO2_12_FULL_60_25]